MNRTASPRGVKLTRPQAELLAEIAGGQRYASEGYKPLTRLLELGLVVKESGRFSDRYTASEAGRTALAAFSGSKGETHD